jgi:hypothetical protein
MNFHSYILSLCLLLSTACFSQLTFKKVNTIPVKQNNVTLKMPWVGGHNFCQFSDIDLNFDNKKDLFVFDRSGNKITTYLNNGTPNTVDYTPSEEFNSKFPTLYAWTLLVDYNCDGKEDIFSYSLPIAGIRVWKNTSTPGNLQFTLETNYIKSDYGSSTANLYVSQVDIPAIEDVDGDGDLDVLTFDFSGVIVELHKNLSFEKGYGCDSLIFQLDANGCWGNFSENPNNCSINLNQSCRIQPYIPPLYDQVSRHSGSCSLCLDMDNDGDKEIILGDISCCNMTMLTNGGSATSANMIAFEDSFPANTKYVQQSIFPCGFFVDINNDGKRDLLVSANLPNSSLNKTSIAYYTNTNTDNSPVFNYIKNNFLQDEMIDVGEGAYPVLFDYDKDGLEDLLIANSKMISDSCSTATSYNIFAYKNTGTVSQPSFQLDTSDFADISTQLPSLSNLYPTFGDLDHDGDDDMMIGDNNGQLFYFTNTAGKGNPCHFVLDKSGYPDYMGNPIDVGNRATPQLIDVDRDSLIDMIIGEFGGNINYYQNIGTTTLPVFKLITDSMGKVNVKNISSYGYSIPLMYDYKGKYKLLVGSYGGNIFQYDSIDGNLSGKFNLLDSSFQNIYEGEKTALTLKDITNDDVLDMIIGNHCGGVSFWQGDDSTISYVPKYDALSDINIFPSPSITGIFQITGSEIRNLKIEVYTTLGDLVLTQSLHSKYGVLDLNNVKNGIYLCKILSSTFQTTKKLSIIK